MTEKVLGKLEKIKLKYGQTLLDKVYQFLISDLGKEELKQLKEMVEADKAETAMHPDTHAGTFFNPDNQKIAEKLTKKGYLRRESNVHYSLTRKAFDLFP